MLSALVLAVLGQTYFEAPNYLPADNTRAMFGQQRVSEERPQISLTFQYGINSELVNTTTSDGGTVTQASSRAVLQTGTNSAGSAIVQSHAGMRYTPGQGVIAKFTATFTACVANSLQEIGLGDQTDGFFFGCSGATFGVFHRNAGVTTFVAQSAFNGSRATWDITKGNVYSIAYQWLGYGVIRFYVERPNGRIQLVHQIDYPNTAALPSLSNPILKAWVRAVNTGNTSNLTVATPSFGVFSEGPISALGVHHGFSFRKSVGTTLTAVLTLRNNSTFLGQTNRVRLHVLSFSFTGSGSSELQCSVHRGTGLGGSPSFVDIDSNSSIAAVDTAGTTLDGGIIKRSFELEGNQAMFAALPYPLYIEPGEALTLACRTYSGSSNLGASVNWQEEF